MQIKYGTTQITTREGGEQNSHRKQKTKKKKLSSLGPGSVVGGAEKAKNGVKSEKYRRAKRAQQWPFYPPQTRRFFFFAHANAEPGPRLKNETSRSPTQN